MKKKKEKPNILITGSLGHIGSYLIHNKDFVKCFNQIYLIDNLSAERYVSLFNLPKYGNFSFFNIDLPNHFVKKIVKKSDIVLHLAATTNAEASVNLKGKQKKKNFLSTIEVANLCCKYNKKFIFISSTSIYGSNKGIVDESCGKSDINPQSPYAVSKLKEENFLQTLQKKYNYNNFVILRFGNIFGYSIGIRFHTAVNKFCFQAATNLPITVWKTARNQKRPYLSLVDACRALIFITKNKMFNGEIYNILTNNYTVNDILNVIKKNRKIKVKLVNSRIMNQLSFNVSNEKIKSDSFTFIGSLKEEISNTLKKFSNLNQ